MRINPLDGTEADRDLQALPARPDGIVLPKAEGGASVDELRGGFTDWRQRQAAGSLPIATETPAAMFQLGTYGGSRGGWPA